MFAVPCHAVPVMLPAYRLKEGYEKLVPGPDMLVIITVEVRQCCSTFLKTGN